MPRGFGPDVPLPPDDLTIEFTITITPLNNAQYQFHWRAGMVSTVAWEESGIAATEEVAEATAKAACEKKTYEIKHQLAKPRSMVYTVSV